MTVHQVDSRWILRGIAWLEQRFDAIMSIHAVPTRLMTYDEWETAVDDARCKQENGMKCEFQPGSQAFS